MKNKQKQQHKQQQKQKKHKQKQQTKSKSKKIFLKCSLIFATVFLFLIIIFNIKDGRNIINDNHILNIIKKHLDLIDVISIYNKIVYTYNDKIISNMTSSITCQYYHKKLILTIKEAFTDLRMLCLITIENISFIALSFLNIIKRHNHQEVSVKYNNTSLALKEASSSLVSSPLYNQNIHNDENKHDRTSSSLDVDVHHPFIMTKTKGYYNNEPNNDKLINDYKITKRLGRSCNVRYNTNLYNTDRYVNDNTFFRKTLSYKSLTSQHKTKSSEILSSSSSFMVSGEPFEGMVLEAFSENTDNSHAICPIRDINGNDDDYVDDIDIDIDNGGEYNIKDKYNDRVSCNLEQHEHSSTPQKIAHYELMERVESQLGIMNMHSLDYAYRPVKLSSLQSTTSSSSTSGAGRTTSSSTSSSSSSTNKESKTKTKNNKMTDIVIPSSKLLTTTKRFTSLRHFATNMLSSFQQQQKQQSNIIDNHHHDALVEFQLVQNDNEQGGQLNNNDYYFWNKFSTYFNKMLSLLPFTSSKHGSDVIKKLPYYNMDDIDNNLQQKKEEHDNIVFSGDDDDESNNFNTQNQEDVEEENQDEEKYETLGDRAFAGGSHGEVWLARRRCQNYHYSKNDKERYSSSRVRNKNGNKCDDKQKLIMKRLKVEDGIHLLEAGLREIYFGKLLLELQQQDDKQLFTNYIDHFFIESSSSVKELWIVFEIAGKSLRNFLYTPSMDTGFWVFSTSDFWKDLRMGVAANFKGSKNNNNESKALIANIHPPPSSYQTTSSQHHQNLPDNRFLRQEQQQSSSSSSSTTTNNNANKKKRVPKGKVLFREVLKQLLTSASFLHEQGVCHRDIKPSNIMCKILNNGDDNDTNNNIDINYNMNINKISSVECVLGDFSSAWNDFTSIHLYTNGPSIAEQTDDYSPPEVLLGSTTTFSSSSTTKTDNKFPFDKQTPYSYDSWSIGIVALEMLLGTPHVFSVDQRTRAILTNSMKKQGASDDDIHKALYLAALSQFCIYNPTFTTSNSSTQRHKHQMKKNLGWPLRAGDPLQKASIRKPTCTLQDFHSALRARDPLGVGFDSSTDSLLLLIWSLLTLDPQKRISAKDALNHAYFHEDYYQESSTSSSSSASSSFSDRSSNKSFPYDIGSSTSLERYHTELDIDLDQDKETTISEFKCPKCGRVFDNYKSCQLHTTGRRHAKFCTYDRSSLPQCLSSHSMLPAHPTSGYCDIQGRRPTIEDFHSIHLHDSHQFYGVFDGHWGNLASKYAASKMYDQLKERFADIDYDVDHHPLQWKQEVQQEMQDALNDLHQNFLKIVSSTHKNNTMTKSGTTATILFVTQKAIVVANVGDSRAILSRAISNKTNQKNKNNNIDPQFSSIQLTVDHIASNKTEAKRIESLDGFVTISSSGFGRVNGTLAVSRSIGDAPLAHFLSREPHVVVMTREELLSQCTSSYNNNNISSTESYPSFPCFIVLASDGLWDVVTNQEAIDMVLDVLKEYYNAVNDKNDYDEDDSDDENKNDDDDDDDDYVDDNDDSDEDETYDNNILRWEEDEGGAFQEAAQRLTQEAYMRGSNDNIGVCVVAIH